MAWAAWLKRHLTEFPDAEYFVLYVYWPDGTGHAIVAILIDGKYYLVDPQTGRVYGPIERGTWFSPTDFGPGIKKLLEPYNLGDPKDWKKFPPDYVNPNDSRPWYEDPEVKEWFRRNFPSMDPDDCIWPRSSSGGGSTGA